MGGVPSLTLTERKGGMESSYGVTLGSYLRRQIAIPMDDLQHSSKFSYLEMV